MRLAVFGASGGVGRQVVRLAIERGHSVRAIYRYRPTSPISGSETFVRESLCETRCVLDAIGDVDAVVSAVGLRRKSKSPFSSLLSPPDLTSRFARVLLAAMRDSKRAKRVRAISAAGVGESAERVNTVLRIAFGLSNLGIAYRDLELMEQRFAESSFDWMCVRPTTLTDGPATGRARITSYYGLRSTIPRVDVAAFLLDSLEEGDTEGGKASRRGERAPMITAFS